MPGRGYASKLLVVMILSLVIAGPLCSVCAQAAGEGFSSASSYDDALKAYRVGDYTKAAGILEKYVGRIPSAEAYYLLGYADYKLRKYRAASECFSQAYLIDPALNPGSIFLKK